jgi:tRNA (guanine-N7-)-methyltransferase
MQIAEKRDVTAIAGLYSFFTLHSSFIILHFFPAPVSCRLMQSQKEFIVDGVGLQQELLAKPVIWAEIYGNDHPVELEIGMGKATFLTEQAKAQPNVNFFGIEWASWFWRSGSDRLRRNGCTNARTIRAEALFFLREHVPDDSLTVLHVYFPDPWPKARHHKRRLIQAPFMEQALRALIPGGRLQVVTDHKGYFEENIEPAFKASKLMTVDYNRPGSAWEGEFVGTNFERKYRREGRPFFALAAVKQPERP